MCPPTANSGKGVRKVFLWPCSAPLARCGWRDPRDQRQPPRRAPHRSVRCQQTSSRTGWPVPFRPLPRGWRPRHVLNLAPTADRAEPPVGGEPHDGQVPVEFLASNALRSHPPFPHRCRWRLSSAPQSAPQFFLLLLTPVHGQPEVHRTLGVGIYPQYGVRCPRRFRGAPQFPVTHQRHPSRPRGVGARRERARPGRCRSGWLGSTS
jgi:hypothetical protein